MNGDNRPPLHLVDRHEGLTHERLMELLSAISKLKIGVIGDGCIDIYWHADMTISELSRETPHYPLPVVKEVYSPGAAGNVAANLKALGVREVLFCTVTGDDWRRGLLNQCLRERGIDDSYSTVEAGRITPAYCKPMRHGHQGAWQEDARLDFANRSPLTAAETARLLEKLDAMAEQVDAIAVTDQFQLGVITPEIRERLAYWAGRGKRIAVDSRDRIALYHGVIVKPNELEAMRAFPGAASETGDADGGEWAAWIQAGSRLQARNGAQSCMTLGANGSLWYEAGQTKPVWIPSLPVQPPLDIVGAGDCFLSSLLAAIASGASGADAMALAHISASIVIGKLGTTGTATPDEIKERYTSVYKTAAYG
ncbi:bifunctional heptose 7-phosphate kinase/heptose 1-phosphate adenyltransferase [Paenibacillus cremeus]|uniref:Sugar kinase n=1 Tax=Paenibacillus cremeus TaxID=2163881 RepID=A0A559K7R2_9BACL|nr:PfkB family carbohydrate kinase [Paenibacillus cremeus]TVY08169.1 sugar kinase [Paenibacillus cremeus]